MVVLGIILVAVFLANVVLNIIGSHPRLTHHQISRIQAYYAAWAGVAYTYDRLTAGAWSVPTSSTCTTPPPLNDSDFPTSIVGQNVNISICNRSLCPTPVPTGVNGCIVARVEYTYTP